MQNIYGVYGVGGFAREVMPLVVDHLKREGALDGNVYFVTDPEFMPEADHVNGYPIVSYEAFKSLEANKRAINIAIADGKVRKMLHEQCIQDGVDVFSIKAANVVEMDEIDLADGAVLSPFVTLTSNIKIGKCFQANLYSYVGHDCVIGDYVTFAPGVMCNGNVVIEDFAYLGSGAILRQGTPDKPLVIGSGAVVGAGSFVTKNVEAGTTVIGIPARKLGARS